MMYYIRFQNRPPASTATRILWGLAMVLVLSLLFFFAFTFFLIALGGTLLGLLLQWALGARKGPAPPSPMDPFSPPKPRRRRPPEDDIIDI